MQFNKEREKGFPFASWKDRNRKHLERRMYSYFRPEETLKTKGRASRITAPAVSVDNYAGAFPGSQRNSHGIVNLQEGSDRG
ncbi:hypothetical protein ALC53_07121 [Atta colombica]|uniref:Uncharacterized protein n=1 Tax=Atta colombica TaxID=520822 RepID=A0A195BCQ0_9HYME|nr:hypothetical protein ALC53_07121 [Atta colombica]